MTLTHQLPMPRTTFFEALERGDHISFFSCDWLSLVGKLCNWEGTDLHREAFATQWVTHGAKMREQTQDDRLLVRVLRQWLPPYQGDGLTLYRGESADRANYQQYGLCWTPNVEVATMFASGLNAVRPGGGVLLKAYAPRNSVISGPGRHSNYLQEAEHTVDPVELTGIEILDRFSPADRRPLTT